MTDNDLIADFIGDERQKFDWNYLYDTSWDCLMPVVKKIHQLSLSEFNYNVDDMTQLRKRREHILSMPIHVDIQRLHGLIGEFLRWYNETKKLNSLKTK